MGIDLRFFAKPGKEGQVFVSLDSLIGFLREEPKTPRESKHDAAMNAVADVLEEEYARIKKHQALISDTFAVGGEHPRQTPQRS